MGVPVFMGLNDFKDLDISELSFHGSKEFIPVQRGREA